MIENLFTLRKEANLTRAQLAHQLGVTERRIYTYEKENMEPDLETLMRIADYFSVSVDYLLGRNTQPLPQEHTPPLGLHQLGQRLLERRTVLHLSRKELSAKTGISAAYISVIEKGDKIPKIDTCLKLLNALSLSADAAFRDSLVAAAPEKASYLLCKLSKLTPEQRFTALRILDSIADAFDPAK